MMMSEIGNLLLCQLSSVKPWPSGCDHSSPMHPSSRQVLVIVSVCSGCHNKYHRLADITETFFLTSAMLYSKAGKSKIELPANRFPVRALLPVCRWPPSCHSITWQERERRDKLSSCLFFQGHLSHHEGPILMTSSNSNYFPKASSPNIITIGRSGLQPELQGKGTYTLSPYSHSFTHVFSFLRFSITISKTLCSCLGKWCKIHLEMILSPRRARTCWNWKHSGLMWADSWGLDAFIIILWFTEPCMLVVGLYFQMC